MELNSQQLEAVTHKKGPLLIIAGAGTGKTQVITQRIIFLMREKLANPSEILALTFTDKAANEMVERVDQEMPLGYEEPTISTFHSFCDQILRQDAFFLGMDTDYKLMNESESYIFFKKHLFDFSLDDYRPLSNPTRFIDDILKHFSRLQDENISPEEYIAHAEKTGENIEIAKTFKEFSDLKIKESKMTFADLITTTLRLLTEKPQVLEKYQKKYKYILVDEFQDTNYSQNVLVNMLLLGKDIKGACSESRKNANITVVGDDDQAIYKFRGAAISNILQFNAVYPDSKRVVLTMNYRSNQDILDAAYGLIKHNDPYRLEVTEKINKRLMADKGPLDGAVKLIPTFNALEEAEAISEQILNLVGGDVPKNNYQVFDARGQSSFLDEGQKQGYSFSDIAILVRAKSHIEEILPILRYYKIPYKFQGKKGLYSRAEIRVFISFLKTLQDYKDNVSFFHVLQLDTLDLEIRDFIEIFSEAKRRKTSAFEFLEYLLGRRAGSKASASRERLLEKTFSKNAVISLNLLMDVYDKIFKMLKEGKATSDIIYLFLYETGYLKYLESSGLESEFKIENIAKFFRLVRNFEQNNRDVTVYEYIDYLEHSIEVGEVPSVDEDAFVDYDAVNISTVHGSKGLEFPVVFLPGLVKNRFPSKKMSEKLKVPTDLMKEKVPGGDSDENFQEERRLFYVAATRAEDRLFLTAAQHYGEGKRKQRPSVFLNEVLSREHLEEFDGLEAKHEFSFSKDGPQDDTDYSLLVKDLGNRISYSEINDYENCPKKYRYKYILQIPVPIGHQAKFGIMVHATLRDFYSMLKSSQEGLEGIFEEPTLDDLLALYEKHWRGDAFENEKHAREKKVKGVKMLKDFYNNIYTGKENVLEVEKRFKVNVGDIVVNGAIDRIDMLGKKGAELVDYKTGNAKEQKEVDKDVQLMVYGLYAKEKIGVESIKATLLFLNDGVRIETEIDDVKLDIAREKVLETTELIKNSKFEAIPGWSCQYCDYKNICDEANV